MQRYSLQQLARHQGVPLSPDTAYELLGGIVHRLAVQSDACSNLLADHLQHSRSSSAGTPESVAAASSSSAQQQQQQQQEHKVAVAQMEDHLRHLERVHKDTLRLCQHVWHHPSVWTRWSKADAHLIHTTAEEVRSRHAPALERWVEIARFQRSLHNPPQPNDTDPDQWIRPLLQRRCGIQLLCDHLVKLGQYQRNVMVDAPLRELLHQAGTEASAACDAHWQVVPELIYDGPDFLDTPITTIRPWLYHALVEVLKNALSTSVQQVVATSSSSSSGVVVRDSNPTSHALTLASPPPVVVRVEAPDEANDTVTISVVDQGIGLPQGCDVHDREHLLFGFGTSSASQRWDRLQAQQSYAAVRSPLNSLGVGLPIARTMLQHFGGHVHVTPNTAAGATLHNHDTGTTDTVPHGCTARIELSRDLTILEPRATVE